MLSRLSRRLFSELYRVMAIFISRFYVGRLLMWYRSQCSSGCRPGPRSGIGTLCGLGRPCLSYQGANQVSRMAGFIVAEEYLSRAVDILVTAGLPRCTCVDVCHTSDPYFRNHAPTHFIVDQYNIIFLATSDMVLGDSNPFDLAYLVRYVPLTQKGTRSFPVDHRPDGSRHATGAAVTEYQTVRFLDPRSLAMLHLYLRRGSAGTSRDGIGLTWDSVLALVAFDIDQDNQLVHSIRDEQLRADYVFLKG
ncbi:uncharacterized protein B0H18DRAFT_242374 [Fomitopsis serialis]|uniref:uncharacterized protein n=1 Tax=Fomitopsis serialis TaxID=139415 RepID=UPI0020077EB4|nr:uncharacterized protein B0H18DRAFT_242374 [Neoantrodia serialis]KAH9912583.1 hypothetical protein B0H18DRAFT_242374 [Neoantrodia serialis]